MVLEGKIAIRYEVVADIPELQKLTAEFGKIGSNLNQIARYFHTGGVRSKTMQDEIQSCISELWNLRKDVTRMAGDFHGKMPITENLWIISCSNMMSEQRNQF